MAAWPGWAGDLLSVLGDRNTSANLKFLTEWHSYSNQPCSNNPLLAHVAWPGSTLCKGGPSRNYRTRADGLQATSKQLHEARFAAILAALKTGNPYTYKDGPAVVTALEGWSNLAFAGAYSRETAPVQPPAITGTQYAPVAIRSWSDLQRVFNSTMWQQTGRAQTLAHAGLRELRHRARVR